VEHLAERLKWAWRIDLKDPESYPLNTGSVFFEIEESLKARSQNTQQSAKVPPVPPPPRRLPELVRERTIKAVYEEQNDGTYESALKLAASGDLSSWQKILHALSGAYLIDRVSVYLAPKPRVHFLHRNLLELANLLELNDLTHQGIVEFLEDLCPCGKRHKVEAIRKLRKRWTARKRTKR
jgi:hypothetical protein